MTESQPTLDFVLPLTDHAPVGPVALPSSPHCLVTYLHHEFSKVRSPLPSWGQTLVGWVMRGSEVCYLQLVGVGPSDSRDCGGRGVGLLEEEIQREIRTGG